MVEARDGTKVPVSIVSRKGVKKDGNNPFLLYAYGSYGYSMDAGFSSTRLSLLDRGFVYAIAHIRGGQEMGRDWYEDGKMFNKKNTFTDFVDCGQAMVDLGYTSPQHLYAMGGSAGGLLMGAVDQHGTCPIQWGHCRSAICGRHQHHVGRKHSTDHR